MQGQEEPQILTLTVVDPNNAKHTLKLSPSDSPIELKSCLLEYAPTAIFTNYTFYCLSKALDDYQDFASQEVASNSTLTMSLDLYNSRSSRFHVNKFQQILKHPPPNTSHIIESKPEGPSLDTTPDSGIPTMDLEEIIPNMGKLIETPSDLPPLKPEAEVPPQVPKCLESVCYSEFNPPSAKRKMQGDLDYLWVNVLEGQRYCITCSVSGFYVNSTTAEGNKVVFNPEMSDKKISGRTLPEVLKELSAGFSSNWESLLASGNDWNFIKNSKPVVEPANWLSEGVQEETKLEHDSIRDWNEEFQMVRALPGETPLQRIQKDKAMAKVYHDFVDAAVYGAKSVISGSVQPLNPMDPPKQHLFLFNHIFFSFTEDIGYIVSVT